MGVGIKDRIKKEFPEADYEDFGEAAIMPGFVNCHSHLEITMMRGFLDKFDSDFYSWLLQLARVRSKVLTNEDIKISAFLGAVEGAKAGITCFGDIGRLGKAGFSALEEVGLRGVLFQETEFSPDNKTAEEDFKKLKHSFLSLRERETKLIEVGISPHSTYTVGSKLFEKIADYSTAENIKLAIHAAESEDEKQFMQRGTGFFSEMYQNQDLNWDHPECSSIKYLSKLGVLQAKPLLAHCVKVSEMDVDLIFENGARVAHCPKSNAKFGHGMAPLEAFLDRGIRTGLGSDSMGSNNLCDLFEEARFAALLSRVREDKKRFIDAKEIIETATIGGAKALGLEHKIGTLEIGKQADLIAVKLTSVAQTPVHDVYSSILFSTNASHVVMTMVAGDLIYRDGVFAKVDEAAIYMKTIEIAEKMKKMSSNYH